MRQDILAGKYDDILLELYLAEEQLVYQRERYAAALENKRSDFGR